MIDRRGFLVRTGLGLAATVLATSVLEDTHARFQDTLDDRSSVRGLFNLEPGRRGFTR